MPLSETRFSETNPVGWVEERNPANPTQMLGFTFAQPNLQIVESLLKSVPFTLRGWGF